MSRRWPAAELTPVRKVVSAGRRMPGDPRRGAARVVDEAYSLDGVWSYARPGGRGWASWYVRHEPSGFVIPLPHGSLDACRHETFTGEALVCLADAALGLLLTVREIPDPLIPFGDHDRARGALTWLADHEPALLARIASDHNIDKVVTTT